MDTQSEFFRGQLAELQQNLKKDTKYERDLLDCLLWKIYESEREIQGLREDLRDLREPLREALREPFREPLRDLRAFLRPPMATVEALAGA